MKANAVIRIDARGFTAFYLTEIEVVKERLFAKPYSH